MRRRARITRRRAVLRAVALIEMRRKENQLIWRRINHQIALKWRAALADGIARHDDRWQCRA